MIKSILIVLLLTIYVLPLSAEKKAQDGHDHPPGEQHDHSHDKKKVEESHEGHDHPPGEHGHDHSADSKEGNSNFLLYSIGGLAVVIALMMVLKPKKD